MEAAARQEILDSDQVKISSYKYAPNFYLTNMKDGTTFSKAVHQNCLGNVQYKAAIGNDASLKPQV
jgi:hypothetical protein